jgi:hypothetical protein
MEGYYNRMSRCDIDSDWTSVANGASFVWMTKRAKHRRAAAAPEDLKSRILLEIARIASLALVDMRTAWSTEFRKQPHIGVSRDLLVRTLAWRLQEKAFGGHDRKTEKLLDAYARGKGSDVLFRKIKSGTELVREYRGILHTVTIVSDGFLWQDKKYPNLSVIARAIAGTNWNGPRFFGLRQGEAGRTKKSVVRMPAGARDDGMAPDGVVADARG